MSLALLLAVLTEEQRMSVSKYMRLATGMVCVPSLMLDSEEDKIRFSDQGMDEQRNFELPYLPMVETADRWQSQIQDGIIPERLYNLPYDAEHDWYIPSCKGSSCWLLLAMYLSELARKDKAEHPAYAMKRALLCEEWAQVLQPSIRFTELLAEERFTSPCHKCEYSHRLPMSVTDTYTLPQVDQLDDDLMLVDAATVTA